MALLKRKRVLGVKVEATPGTAESLTNTEGAFNVYDLMIQANIEVEAREAQASFGHLAGVPGARSGTATFKTDIGWDGTAILPSWATVLLAGCGWVNSTGTVSPVSEAPGSGVKTLTIGGYIDGVKKLLSGCAGTFQLVCPTGKQAYIDWTFNGVWQPPTDVALLAPAYPTASPIRYASATSEFGGVAMCTESVTFDAGNDVQPLLCASSAAGYKHYLITDRSPTITADPEAALVATQDRFGQWIAASEAEFAVTLDGPGTGTLKVVAAKAQITNLQEADRQKIVTDGITFSCNKNGTSNDQELQFIFTAAI